MTIKAVVTTDEYHAIDSETQKLYKKDGDQYIIDISGADDLPDISGLRDNRSRLKSEKQKLQDRLNALESTATEQESERIKEREANSQFEELYTSLRDKSAGTEEGLRNQIATLTADRDRNKINNTVSEIALALGGAERQAAWIPHVAARVSVIAADGGSEIVYLDKDGKRSVIEKADLIKEFELNETFKFMLKPTGSSGSSASGSGPSSGNSESEEQGYFNRGSKTWSMTKQAAVFKRDPELARKLKAKGEGG